MTEKKLPTETNSEIPNFTPEMEKELEEKIRELVPRLKKKKGDVHEKLYLQVANDDRDYDIDVLWCEDRINETDIEYRSSSEIGLESVLEALNKNNKKKNEYGFINGWMVSCRIITDTEWMPVNPRQCSDGLITDDWVKQEVKRDTVRDLCEWEYGSHLSEQSTETKQFLYDILL